MLAAVFVYLCCVTFMAKGNDCRIRSIHVRQDGGLCFEIPPWQLQPVQLDEHLKRLRKKLATSSDLDFRKVMHERKALVNRSIHVRQDGGLCFEIPPWQLQPVQLDEHLKRLRKKLAPSSDLDFRKVMHERKALVNSEVSRYMDTVLAPFLDAYHRNIQNSYQLFTVKILKRIKEEINTAVQKKQKIYTALMNLADELKVPDSCDEERRAARTLASEHVANIHSCVEQARDAIAKMGPYAEQMILITKQHMQTQLGDASNSLNEGTESMPKGDVAACKKELSRAAASLGYELDLTLSNARRFSEQSCEQLTGCSTRARRQTDEAEADLRDKLYQCVYA